MAAELLNIDIPLAGQPHRLVCYRHGSPHMEAVLCVHGLTRNGRDFDFLASALQRNYQVLCPDMPGRGKSDRLSPLYYNYQTYLFDLQCLLTSLGISRLHWIGTSMGGILGMMMAGAMPGLIASLVLNDVGCIVAAAGLKRILSYAGSTMEFPSRSDAEAALRDIFIPFGIREEAHWRHIFTHSIEDLLSGGARFAYDPAIAAGLGADPALAQDINLWPLWEAVKSIPTLLIRGAESDILTPETARQMQQNHPCLSLHEVASTGHAPMLMEPEQIAVIEAWLSERD